MLSLSYPELIEFLKKEGHSPEMQEETQQVLLPVKAGEHELAAFFRISEGPLLQCVTFLPIGFQKSTVSDTARMLHLINKEVDLPGFGIDEISETVFYRTVIPCLEGKLDPELLKGAIRALDIISASFLNAINAVAQGAITFDEAVRRAQEAAQ